MHKFLTIATGCLICSAAHADFFTSGYDLEKMIQSNDPLQFSIFRGYVAGIFDFNKEILCKSDYIPMSEADKTVREFIKENPELKKSPAKLIVISALTKKYGCN